MHLIPTHQLTVSRSGLHKIQHGIYATEAPRGPQHAHLLRTQAALSRRQGPHAASHISAAVAHRLPLFDEDLSVVHLTTDEAGRRGRRAGVHVHEGPIEDAVATAGIMVTPLARTLLDCARTLPRDQAVAMADYALHHRLTTKGELAQLLEASTGWRRDRARRTVQLADGRAESVGETRSRLILQDAGFQVTPQVHARDADGVAFARIDLVVDGLPLAVEFEGRIKAERTKDGGRSNKERNDLVEDNGWVIVPVYWEHLYQPQVLLARVHRGARRAQRLL